MPATTGLAGDHAAAAADAYGIAAHPNSTPARPSRPLLAAQAAAASRPAATAAGAAAPTASGRASTTARPPVSRTAAVASATARVAPAFHTGPRAAAASAAAGSSYPGSGQRRPTGTR